jgi:hypothetical protein
MSMERRAFSGGKANLTWFVVSFVALQIGLAAFIDWRLPRIYDREYGVRLAALRKCLVAEPDRPLLLVVGSSRVTMGFLPELLPELRTRAGLRVLPFNFSHLASGPVMNLMLVRRLIREDIRPQWLVLELVPGMLANTSVSVLAGATAARDLPVVCRYGPPEKLLTVYARQRLIPWYQRRLGLLREIVPSWAPYQDPREQITLTPLGGDHAWLAEAAVDPAEVRRRTEADRPGWVAIFQEFHVHPAFDQATRELLELCRRERVAVALLATPESSPFRTWYSAAARLEIEQYLARISREYGVPVIDARAWLPDSDYSDSQHPLQRGAVVFTHRLGREVLAPLVMGRLAYPKLLTAR